jgi:hypothetical protein
MKRDSITFKLCGLNTKNNFLQAPICECGCGEYANLVLKEDDDVCGFMHTMLEEHCCERCGIFAFKQNGTDVLMGLKLDGEVKCYKANIDGGVKNSLVDIQKALRLHCYGLLDQVGDDLYSIVMD